MIPPLQIDGAQWAYFVDEPLREKAIAFAEHLLEEGIRVKRHQLHSIPTAIQAGGLKELLRLAKKQAERETRNKTFWLNIRDHIDDSRSQDKSTLYHTVRTALLGWGKIEDEETVSDDVRKKQIRKQNRKVIEAVMDDVVNTYFEHFRCHYSFRLPE
ncbi:hypothetical protein [Desulfatirhabdium butyrativorans]|uniref:hypothetical protein n=1 Tax=Desulfatirhabdium butyrativorans TaxID=340467 RepID=UPI000427B551|nr:hypothetical protein [Desulfatirhabdium butyrativorans]